MFLLKFIFLIFVAAFVAVLFIVWSFVRQVRNVSNRFRNQQDYQQRYQPGRQTQADGNVVIDQRSPETARQRIIPDNEGEYVDFEES